MKKLLTIALALVMVLALAAPAMATVGFGPAAEAEAATKTEFTVKIRALEFVPATSGFTFENNYYADFDPTKGIVAGSDIRFVVDVTFPKYGDVAAADEFEKYDDNLCLYVTGNNLAFGWVNTGYTLSIINSTSTGHEYFNGSLPRVTTNSPTKTVKYMTIAADYDNTPWYIADNSVNTVYYNFHAQKNFDDAYNANTDRGAMGLSKYYTTTYSFMFVADVLNTADVTVTAAIDATGYADQFAKNKEYSFIYNSKKYTVKHTANSDGSNYFDMWNQSDPRNVVRFTTDSKDQITNVAVTTNSGTAFGYTTVTPLTTAQFNAAQLIVNAIAAGTDTKRVEAVQTDENITALKAWLVAPFAVTATNAIGEPAAIWINQMIAFEPTAAITSATNAAEVVGYVNTAATGVKTLAGFNKLLSAAGQAAFAAAGKYSTTAKAATMTEAKAWAEYNTVYDAKLVIGLPGDKLASSITGVPVTGTNGVIYGAIEPFLGTVDATATMTHAQWWNVNKDVRLAEIVFNLNDAVHTGGYRKTTTSDATAITASVNKFAAPPAAGHSNFYATSYAWCAADALGKVGTVYFEVQNLYDEKDVTASKDVNKVMYNKLYPVFKEMMTVLGFEWDGTTAYMYRAAFVEKFGGKLYNEASYTYAAYTSALVVADPNAQPPQTGDTTSILGFVMIAVAVLAAGAVVVKKVRA